MCHPVVAVVASLLSTAAASYSAYASGENAKEVADYNAEMDRRAADDALQRGSIDAAEHRQKVRQMISQQNANMSTAGVDTSTGTPLEVMSETAGMGELDALRIVNNAQRQAAGLKAQSELEVFRGNAAQQAGYFNTAGTALGGIGNAAAGYYGMKRK